MHAAVGRPGLLLGLRIAFSSVVDRETGDWQSQLGTNLDYVPEQWVLLKYMVIQVQWKYIEPHLVGGFSPGLVLRCHECL